MTTAQAAADRHVINTARAFERASQYGINTGHAARAYDQARDRQQRLRGRRAS